MVLVEKDGMVVCFLFFLAEDDLDFDWIGVFSGSRLEIKKKILFLYQVK